MRECVLQWTLLYLADIALWSVPFESCRGASCWWMLFLSWKPPSCLWGRSQQWWSRRKRSLLPNIPCIREAHSGRPPRSCGKACSRYFMASRLCMTYFSKCLVSPSSQLKTQQRKTHMQDRLNWILTVHVVHALSVWSHKVWLYSVNADHHYGSR